MMPMDPAWAEEKMPDIRQPTKVMKMPSCAAAPKSRLLGLAIRGPKSVIAPTPMKIRQG